jgi:hypothetical protein
MERTKYFRTLHLPNSPGASRDDLILADDIHFVGRDVVITEKMDGENTTLYSDGYIHARSIDSGHHESRNWIKKEWAKRWFKLPPNYRICGENLYAQHSIHYDNLESYFYIFSIWENDTCLSWGETCMWADELMLPTVPVLYQDIYIHNMHFPLRDNQEGYVVRLAGAWQFADSSTSIAKYVRQNHVQTNEHWMFQKIIKNGLK